jgi:glucose/arabinose dehydrogenase
MSTRRWSVTAGTAVIVLAFLTMTAGSQTPQDDRPALSNPPPAPLEQYYARPPDVTVETFLEGLDVVWGLQFAPDKRLFLTEKPGRIRVVSPNGTLDPTPWATLPNVNAESRERGLFGVALHPQFPGQPWVYVMYTAQKGDRSVNRVSRFREVGGRGTGEEVLIDDLPSAGNHNGGRIRFGPDGMLYIGAGEAGGRARAQDLKNPGGSILRIAPDGTIPQDNPFPANPIWAYGLRNPQALAFRPTDGALFVGDHGPTGEWQQPRIAEYDELNIVRKGGIYGWPLVIGAPG